MRDAVTFVRLVPCVCTLIVAAFQPSLAVSAALVEDVPVPGGTAQLAQSLGIHPVPDRARFMAELTRLVYDTSEYRSPSVAAFLAAMRQPDKKAPSVLGPPNAAEAVPVPLSADLWSDAVFHRKVTRETLVAAIIADRQASLLCHGLTRLDDETLEYFASHPAMLTRIYERDAPVFAAFAGGLQIRTGRVVPAAESIAVPLWETVVGEKVTRADRFLLALLEQSEGRVAYLYDAVASFDPARRAFVLGAWMADAQRLDRFKVLATEGIGAVREWHVRTLPFGRSSHDFVMTVARLRVDEQGRPLPPASRSFWSRIFNGPDSPDDSPFDAAWLAENVTAGDVRMRGDRVDQLTFAQRVFGSAAIDEGEAQFVVRSMPRFRALLLTFERAGVRTPATYGLVLRHAAKLMSFEGRRGYVVQAQLQSSLVLLARMAVVQTIDVPTFERLVGKLVQQPPGDNGYAGAVARWLRNDVHPLLPPAPDVDSAIVAGLSGRPIDIVAAPRVLWEGQRYRLDLATTEQTRLQRVRERQAALPIDVPLQMADAAQTLRAEKISLDDLQDVGTQLAALARDIPQRSRDEEADDAPIGVAPPPPLHEILKKAIEEVAKAERGKDLKRAPRIGEPIVELADDLLARNLLSFAYAISLGDPEGTVLLADDVSHRHDFGFAVKDADVRARLTWAIPRQEVSPGVPWHVSGSVLGLDIGVATLMLRRVVTDRMLEAPRLTSNARDTFASSVSLMDPLELRDADRDAIATAIAAGLRRLTAVDERGLDDIARELTLEPARLRAVRWTVAHGTADVSPLFSMTEMLVLGGGRIADLQPWGMGAMSLNGCLCTQLLPPGAWRLLGGRPQLGLTAAVLPDVNFRVTMVLKELDLPAALARVVLSAAIQDFIDEARPTDDDDWLTLSRTARAITRERIEDYVSAATATGPLLPDANRSPEGRAGQVGQVRWEGREGCERVH